MLHFTKMQGLGNDFVVIDATENSAILDLQQIRHIADRKYGVGCDQLLLIEPISSNTEANNNTAPERPQMPHFRYRIFNGDGSEAEQCGNGARCVIEYLYTHKNIAAPAIMLSTKTSTLIGSKTAHGIQISMSIPSFAPVTIPSTHTYDNRNIYSTSFVRNDTNTEIRLTYGLVSMGNPHVVIELTPEEMQNRDHLEYIAKFLQDSPLFPQSINVNFFTVINPTQITLLTYERAAGFTLACGSGACATACYGIQQKKLNANTEIDVNTPGGTLQISWDGINAVVMTGPAVTVFSGSICI